MLFRLWCEWDIGHENLVFRTKEDALDFAKTELARHDFDEDYTFDMMVDDGLVGTEDVRIWTPVEESVDLHAYRVAHIDPPGG